MTQFNFRKTKLEDLEHIKKNMRKEDRDELLCFGDIEKSLLDCYLSDICLTFLFEGYPAFLFGLHPDGIFSKKACVFLISTNLVDKFPKTFYKFTKDCVKKALEDYEILYNIVDFRYKKSLRWLSKLGAVFLDETFINGNKFLYFEIRR